jgi:hypothetical protein
MPSVAVGTGLSLRDAALAPAALDGGRFVVRRGRPGPDLTTPQTLSRLLGGGALLT